MQENTISDLISLDSSTIVDLLRIYYDVENEPSSYYPFTSNSNGFNGPIVFQGVRYNPLPAELEDISSSTQDRFSRPKLTISNDGLIISRILRQKNDFKNAKLVRIRTQLRSIDDINFDGGENPFGPADPENIISTETFIFSQKLAENRLQVQFELVSPLDIQEFDIPGRLILPRYCYWNYRGAGCGFYGPPIETAEGTPFPAVPDTANFSYATYTNEWQYDQNYQSGAVVFVETNRDPYRTFYVANVDHLSNEINQPSINALIWTKDGCSKTIGGCRKRWLNTGISYTGDVTIQNPVTIGKPDSSLFLPFGGYPSVDGYSFGTPR